MNFPVYEEKINQAFIRIAVQNFRLNQVSKARHLGGRITFYGESEKKNGCRQRVERDKDENTKFEIKNLIANKNFEIFVLLTFRVAFSFQTLES